MDTFQFTPSICTSPLFGSGEVYHCNELDCPVHGERNRTMIDNPRAGKRLGREEDDESESVQQDIKDGYRCEHGVCIPESCTKCYGGRATTLTKEQIDSMQRS